MLKLVEVEISNTSSTCANMADLWAVPFTNFGNNFNFLSYIPFVFFEVSDMSPNI